MNTSDTELVTMLRDSIERYAEAHYRFEQRRAVLKESCGYSIKAWADYANHGWLAMRLPEEAGGMAAGPAAIGALMEVSGARLLMEPLLASVVVGTGLLLRLANAQQRAALLPGISDGSIKLAFAHEEALAAHAAATITCQARGGQLHGRKLMVLHGDCADRLIVSALGDSGQACLYLVDARQPQLQRQSYPLLDGRRAATIDFAGIPAEPLGEAGPPAETAIAWAQDEAAVALCSETLGAMRALNAATLQYLKVRKQFGRTLGSNQALQHRMVEMTLLVEEVRALTLAAQAVMQCADAAERTRVISGTRAYACSAARRIANEAVQMHGGIGVTEELDVSHYYRRLMVLNSLFGNRDYHLARFSAASARLDTPAATT